MELNNTLARSKKSEEQPNATQNELVFLTEANIPSL